MATTEQIKNIWVNTPKDLLPIMRQIIADEFDAWLAGRDRAVAEAAWDEAISTVIAHLDTPRMVWTGSGEVTVYDSLDHLNAGRPQPRSLTDWLRSIASPYRSVPEENK